LSLNEVLLIDDEEVAVIRPLVAAFKEIQIGVDTASTWESGLEEFLIGGHPLVVADWNLRGSRNGLLLLARMKRLRPGSHLVLFSGFLDDDQLESVEALPFVDRALAKGPELMPILAEEARAALDRARTGTDWAALAVSYRSSVETDFKAVERLEQRLRTGATE
jgi:DNA-binding NtrC family response regulator